MHLPRDLPNIRAVGLAELELIFAAAELPRYHRFRVRRQAVNGDIRQVNELNLALAAAIHAHVTLRLLRALERIVNADDLVTVEVFSQLRAHPFRGRWFRRLVGWIDRVRPVR